MGSVKMKVELALLCFSLLSITHCSRLGGHRHQREREGSLPSYTTGQRSEGRLAGDRARLRSRRPGGQLEAASGLRSQDRHHDGSRGQSGLRDSNSPRSSVKEIQSEANSIASCPGSSLESCIKTCPSHTAQAYGGCVGRCSEMCD